MIISIKAESAESPSGTKTSNAKNTTSTGDQDSEGSDM
jgi:hypothetical protein